MMALEHQLTDEQRELAMTCYWLAMKIAGDFLSRFPGIEREEMTSTASLALVLAAKGFDPSRGCKFSTLTYHAVTNGLKGLVRNTYGRRIPTVTIDAVDPVWPDDHDAPIDDALLAQTRDQAPIIVGKIDWQILVSRSQGQTLRSIGCDVGMTKERVRQRELRAKRKLRLALA